MRKHGNVTAHLFRASERSGLEVPLRGFGGSFQIVEDSAKSDGVIPFVAGGFWDHASSCPASCDRYIASPTLLVRFCQGHWFGTRHVPAIPATAAFDDTVCHSMGYGDRSRYPAEITGHQCLRSCGPSSTTGGEGPGHLQRRDVVSLCRDCLEDSCPELAGGEEGNL